MNREGRDDPILPLARLDEIALDYLKKTTLSSHRTTGDCHRCSQRMWWGWKRSRAKSMPGLNRRRGDPESAGPEKLSLVAEEFAKIREEEEDVV